MREDPYAWSTMVATWISAGAAASGVLLALVAGIVALRIYSLESQRDHAAELERRRRRDERERQIQADSVCVWCERNEVVIANGSSLPVYEVQVVPHVRATIGSLDRLTSRVVPPGRHTLSGWKTSGATMRNGDFGVSIEFTDAAGIRWARSVSGRLSRAPSSG